MKELVTGTISNYKSSVSIISCSFTNFVCSEVSGGAVSVWTWERTYRTERFTVILSNFTSCSSTTFGGAIRLQVEDAFLFDSCRFENCAATGKYTSGGAITLTRGNPDAIWVNIFDIIDRNGKSSSDISIFKYPFLLHTFTLFAFLNGDSRRSDLQDRSVSECGLIKP
ncbi:hypothetical protein BLNAU_9254 [Blattamonas nauphoetae]|uniref:Uncharacterized protein n=1 Tax=Blattamonas nauphoetae TaxID=2049346 RepID=A0ABQ9XW54_9EUKA|nr:hypothetical protein BLNAU_9254 [Blattamonas nauphoetae]